VPDVCFRGIEATGNTALMKKIAVMRNIESTQNIAVILNMEWT
jgi:hypothetical protein